LPARIFAKAALTNLFRNDFFARHFCPDLAQRRSPQNRLLPCELQQENEQVSQAMMVTTLMLFAALAAGQLSGIEDLFPNLLLSEATAPPAMCGLSANSTEELAQAVRTAPRFAKASISSDRFEVYGTSDRMQEFVLTRDGQPAHPAVACREIRNENGALELKRYMNCSGPREACNQLFLDFRTLDSQLKDVPTDNQLSLP
jgi:hypothetical protein